MMHDYMDTQVVAIQVWPLQIPLRQPFKHATAERSVADPLVVEVELANGTIGYGETLARPYVTGETPATVQAALGGVLLEALVDARPQSMSEVLELVESLPWQDRDRQDCPAARAGLELALLDAYSRFFQRDILQLSGWFDDPGFGPPGSTGHVRYAIVLGSAEPRKIQRQIRLARLCGIRDFKLKMGDPDLDRDRARLDAAIKVLSWDLESQRVTLRVDANGAWKKLDAMYILSRMEGLPLAAVEQPTPRGTEEIWQDLHEASGLPIMADESVVTFVDAEVLLSTHAVQFLNLRISKNGGLTAAIRLAALARRWNCGVMIGCMVGETAILSAAQVKMLNLIDNASFVEGCFGRLLLRDDVGKRVQFGIGGRVPKVPRMCLGARVDRDRLASLCPEGPTRLSP
jgi:muconate cycloisomerase